MIKSPKKIKIKFEDGKGEGKIDWKLLEKIAYFYEFPVAAYFSPVKMFRGTRKKFLLRERRRIKNKILKAIEDL